MIPSSAGSEPPLEAHETSEIFDPGERLEFERLLQWLRLSFLLMPVLVLLASGAPALGSALFIAIAVIGSYSWVWLLARYRPHLLLRHQLLLRVLDCVLVYLVLVNYHAFLHNAYYDAVYVLFVVAAAATHRRRGGWLMAGVAGLAVLISRLQLIFSNAMVFEPRHLTDPVFYTVFFVLTSSAVAYLMDRTAEVVGRRQRAWHAELAARNTQLAESIQMRDAMLTGVTHDLRTPLTVIKLQAQLLRRRRHDPPAAAAEQIERAVTRMARWIDELLEVATVKSADDLHLMLATTDLLQLVRLVVAEHALGTKRHTITIEAERSDVVGQFDASRMVRVLDNLVGNAIKYSPQGGSVRVQVTADDDQATIIVTDCGLGIPAEDLPHVF
ncbi:MAG TPA: HAMP domain-containing sensor histidine kinase, partial [Chloroflexota bacterium]|nr:HAMP domain-containing sensor histidine kinase [Chloroflexota bacterium]